jgi:hypothetical protein
VYAYSREIAKGDTFNLVAILQAHHGFTLEHAMETVAHLIESELMSLRLLAVSATSSRTERYIQSLKDMVAAILTWSRHTLRYG